MARAICTGTLLNDADPTTQIPYFLTAWHCPDNQEQVSSMEFHWFYERDTCGGPAPEAVTRQAGGATILAASDWWSSETGVDSLPVRLNSDPPAGVALARWTTSGTVAGNSAVGVSHPAGDLKKLTRQSVLGFSSYMQEGSSHISSRALTRPDVNLEGGSSRFGARKRIDGADYLVGVATSRTGSACTGDVNSKYGRFDLFYPKVSRWLGAPGACLGCAVRPDLRASAP